MNMTISPAKEIAKMTAWVILFSMVIPAIIIGIIYTIMSRSYITAMIGNENMLMVAELLAYAATIPVLVLTRKKLRSLSTIEIGREKPTPAGVAVGVSAGVAGEGLAVFLLTAIIIIFGIKDDSPDVIIGTNVLLQIITVSICPPILEEYAMRGLLFAGIRRYKSFTFAAVFSSVVFALLHMNPVGTVWYFAIGLILAYIYEKKHSLVLNIIVHAAINLTATLLTIIPERQGQSQSQDISQTDTKTLIAFIIAGLICVGIVLLCMRYFNRSAVSEGSFYSAPYDRYAASANIYPQNQTGLGSKDPQQTYIYKNGAYYSVDMKPGEYIAGVDAGNKTGSNSFIPANISQPDEKGYVTVQVQGKDPVKIKICIRQSE